MTRLLPLAGALFVVVGAALLAACGGADVATPTHSTGGDATSAPTEEPLTGSITVFAASSLTASFQQMGSDFEAAHAGAHVTFNFGGSQELRTQLEQGAEADVFASADTNQMDLAMQSGVVAGDARTFAHNRLVIITPKDNPAHIETPQGLAKDGIKLVIAADTVPVGKYTRKFLEAADADNSFGAGYSSAVLANVVSNANNVKEVVAAVQLGEADAGVVYVTDITPGVAGDVARIEIPDSVNQVATYPIALTPAGAENGTARAFVDYVLGEQGQATLASFGFLKGEE